MGTGTPAALVHALLAGKGLTRTTAPVSAGLLTALEASTDALTAYRRGDAQPIVNAARLREALDVPAMSVQRALAQLTEAGVLQEATGRSRNRVWQHRGVLAVLDEYAEQVRRAD